jgi:Fe-S-cluster-containing dehydrogenase component
MAHAWESWGDARGHDGTATIMQPQALPLYGGMAPIELLALFVTPFPGSTMEMVQDTWRSSFGNNFDKAWHEALASGVVPNTASGAAAVKLQADAKFAPSAPTGELWLTFRPDPSLWDGRYANNPWLQELPRPLNKLTWDNPLLIAPALAKKLKLREGDMVRLAVGSRQITVPVWVQPGQAPDVLVAWLGNGRRINGGLGEKVGFDYYPLTGASGKITLEKVRGQYVLASAAHHNMLVSSVQDPVKHTALDEFHHTPDFAKTPPSPELYNRQPPGPEAWAMSVDLNACIGCNACVVACQAENNVPVVGKGQVEMEREMYWLRIDRYYEGTIDEPDTFFQPMFCQMCEKAPCEIVCPPGATVHNAEGLNLMVYNRCIGTRFCSNNCPYKVRRFNFYPYAAEQDRPDVSWNPNVTVRSRGVMEKCTYCLQRIAEARIAADRESKPIPTDSFTTACAQACPTQAFTFGNLKDAKSVVNERKKSPLGYTVLADQNTHPRTTYEALVRNPNPAIKATT